MRASWTSTSRCPLADGLGHAVEHERERGALEPRDRAARRAVGQQEAGAPQRPREQEPELERHVPDGDAHRGGARAARAPAAGARDAGQGARGEGGRVQRGGEARAHAHAGRGPAAARRRVRRVRAPGAHGHPARQGRAAAPVRAGRGRHRRRHRAQHARGLRRGRSRRGGALHGPAVRHRAQQVRGARGARRAGRGARRAQHGGRLVLEDRQRRAPALVRPALRHRRDRHPRERAGLEHHARQSEPDAVRGDDNGGRAGDGQPGGRLDRRRQRPPRAQRVQAAHRAQRAAQRAPAERRGQLVHRALRRGHRAAARAHRAAAARLADARDGAQPTHRLRQGGKDRQERTRQRPHAAPVGHRARHPHRRQVRRARQAGEHAGPRVSLSPARVAPVPSDTDTELILICIVYSSCSPFLITAQSSQLCTSGL